jgi:hypothetical protein
VFVRLGRGIFDKVPDVVGVDAAARVRLPQGEALAERVALALQVAVAETVGVRVKAKLVVMLAVPPTVPVSRWQLVGLAETRAVLDEAGERELLTENPSEDVAALDRVFVMEERVLRVIEAVIVPVLEAALDAVPVALTVAVFVLVRVAVDVRLTKGEFEVRGLRERVPVPVEEREALPEEDRVGLADELREALVVWVPVGDELVVFELLMLLVAVHVTKRERVKKLLAEAVLLDKPLTVLTLAEAVFVGIPVRVKAPVGLTDLVEVVLGVTRDVGKLVFVPVVVFVDVFDAVDVYVWTAAVSRRTRSLFMSVARSNSNISILYGGVGA